MTLVGRAAPEFELASTRDLDSLTVPARLADHRGRWLVLFFYPGDFTLVCPGEAQAFSAAVDRFAALDADVVGVSTDSVHAHVAWMEFHVGSLRFPLAADRTHAVCRAYGVLDEDAGAARRAVFLVDPDGVVRYEVVHDDRVARNVDEILRVLAAVQAGDRSPVDWSADAARCVNGR